MKMIHRLVLAAAFAAAPNLAFADNHELARAPHGIDTPVPEPAPPAPASSKKITIYTAKTIVTLDPGTPSAEAVAVIDGKILGVGTLDEVKGWVTNQELEIDRRFQDAVIIPGRLQHELEERSMEGAPPHGAPLKFYRVRTLGQGPCRAA